MKVIINADDLGKSLEVNNAIEKCIQKGLITSTTIMACGSAFEDAIRIAKSYPQISFGVHLTIDDGDICLTKSEIFKKVGITDDKDRFIRHGIKSVDVYTKELKNAIYNEWNAQISRVREAGVNISHVDSHHHNHTILPLKKTLIKLLRDNKVKCVRLSQTKTISMYLHGISLFNPKENKSSHFNDSSKVIYKNEHNKLFIALNILKRLVWTEQIKNIFATTDYFCSYAMFLNNKENLSSFFKNGTLELMCHPGHPNYEEETIALSLLDKNIVKTNYLEL